MQLSGVAGRARFDLEAKATFEGDFYRHAAGDALGVLGFDEFDEV